MESIVTTHSSSEYLLSTSKEYAIYVCENRAIPKVADGLKDSQRKMLWIIRNRSEKIKTISLSGLSISENLYLHGDQSASDTISMLAAPFCNNVTLLDGIGSFGTRTSPTGWGAPRYTYVKRGKAAQELLYTDLDIVPIKENYDGSTKEPIHFLPLIPIVLLNGVSGIAVGWSTEILPRSLPHLIDACVAALDDKKVSQIIPHYDYLTCDTCNIEGNTWQFSGRVSIIDSSTIKITELPPDLTLEKFKERLNEYEEKDKINNYTDRSTKTIDITVKFPRGSIKEWTQDYAVEFFKLRQRKTERIVVIDWNVKGIHQYNSAEELVTIFVTWRLGWFIRRYQNRLDNDSYELLYWKAVKACFDGKLPARLELKIDRKAVENDILHITQSIGIDSKQVDRIVNLPTYKWAKDSYTTVLEHISLLENNIQEYNRILASEKTIKSIYRKELLALKKLKF